MFLPSSTFKGLLVTGGNKSSVAGVLVNQFGLSIGTDLIICSKQTLGALFGVRDLIIMAPYPY